MNETLTHVVVEAFEHTTAEGKVLNFVAGDKLQLTPEFALTLGTKVKPLDPEEPQTVENKEPESPVEPSTEAQTTPDAPKAPSEEPTQPEVSTTQKPPETPAKSENKEPAPQKSWAGGHTVGRE